MRLARGAAGERRIGRPRGVKGGLIAEGRSLPANALAEAEGGSAAAVVFCPGLPGIRSLLMTLVSNQHAALCHSYRGAR